MARLSIEKSADLAQEQVLQEQLCLIGRSEDIKRKIIAKNADTHQNILNSLMCIT